MSKMHLIVAALVLVALLAGSARDPAQDIDALAAEVARLDLLSIPVGGVILWWGLQTDIPENFEVCDGRAPKARDARFTYRKPDMRGRFAFGAPNEQRYRPWGDNMGGSNELTIESEPAAVTQFPQHAHPMDHDHNPAHDHSLGNHTHTLNGHTHEMSDHRHGLDHTHQIAGTFATYSLVVDDKDGTPIELLQADAKKKAPISTEPPPKGTLTGENNQGTGAPVPPLTSAATGSTGTSKVGRATPDETQPVQGNGQQHSHDVEIEDSRPAFTEFLFIIRVK